MYKIKVINLLNLIGLKYKKGLTEEEILNLQIKYNIKFPPDLKKLLSIALPISKGFVYWRDSSEKNVEFIKKLIEMPFEGILYDIKNSDFWFEDWGEKPNDINCALNLVKEKFKKVTNTYIWT